MRYNLKTGRFNFGVKDILSFLKKHLSKHSSKNNDLSLKRQYSENQISENTQITDTFNKKSIFLQLKNKNGKFTIVKKAIYYTVGTAIMSVMLYGSFVSLDLTFAKEAIINGQKIGIINNEKSFEKLNQSIYEELNAKKQDFDYEMPKTANKPEYITCIAFKKGLTDEHALRQNILSTYNCVTTAYAVYVDDNFVTAAFDKNDIDKALNAIKSKYKNPDGAEIDFVQKVSILKENVPIFRIKFGDKIASALQSTTEINKEYTIMDGDTLWTVATKNGMTTEELEEINDNLENNFLPGKVINVTSHSPLLSVKATYNTEWDADIAYNTKTIDDNSIYDGMQEIKTVGVNGTKHMTSQIVSINGIVASDTVIEEKITKKPVDEVIKVGVKYNPGIGTGTFLRPTYGAITSRFGYRRSGKHTGIDYGSPVGTDIRAADTGKVIFAGWLGGYGNCVKIDHNNGYVTYYAHCSSISVTQGQVVKKGDIIAKVGSTGNSTGPHLHFEIRHNDEILNPESYVN